MIRNHFNFTNEQSDPFPADGPETTLVPPSPNLGPEPWPPAGIDGFWIAGFLGLTVAGVLLGRGITDLTLLCLKRITPRGASVQTENALSPINNQPCVTPQIGRLSLIQKTDQLRCAMVRQFCLTHPNALSWTTPELLSFWIAQSPAPIDPVTAAHVADLLHWSDQAHYGPETELAPPSGFVTDRIDDFIRMFPPPDVVRPRSEGPPLL